MTDLRRQTIAALQQSPGDLPLLIANAALCQGHTPIALQNAARALGVMGRTYDASEDAGSPHNTGETA